MQEKLFLIVDHWDLGRRFGFIFMQAGILYSHGGSSSVEISIMECGCTVFTTTKAKRIVDETFRDRRKF